MDHTSAKHRKAATLLNILGIAAITLGLTTSVSSSSWFLELLKDAWYAPSGTGEEAWLWFYLVTRATLPCVLLAVGGYGLLRRKLWTFPVILAATLYLAVAFILTPVAGMGRVYEEGFQTLVHAASMEDVYSSINQLTMPLRHLLLTGPSLVVFCVLLLVLVRLPDLRKHMPHTGRGSNLRLLRRLVVAVRRWTPRGESPVLTAFAVANVVLGVAGLLSTLAAGTEILNNWRNLPSRWSWQYLLFWQSFSIAVIGAQILAGGSYLRNHPWHRHAAYAWLTMALGGRIYSALAREWSDLWLWEDIAQTVGSLVYPLTFLAVLFLTRQNGQSAARPDADLLPTQ